MSTEEFHDRLKLGKYTRWAAHLTDDQLEGLLWALGEYGCRASVRGEEFQRLLECARESAPHPRAVAGLRLALEFAGGRHRTLGEVQAEIRAALAGGWGAAGGPAGSDGSSPRADPG
jgi:hypothetical protein